MNGEPNGQLFPKSSDSATKNEIKYDEQTSGETSPKF